MSEDELFSTEGNINQLPSTILELLKIKNSNLPPSINLSKVIKKKFEQVIIVLIDNFGLFECMYYKPKFLIINSKAMILLNSSNPFSKNIINNLIFADNIANSFSLIEYLEENNLTTVMIDSDPEIKNFEKVSQIKSTENDTQTYVQSIKVLNRFNFIWIHFLDFEKMYSYYNFQPPSTTAQKLITRTDNWILTLYKQLKSNSMLIIIGTHGKREMDMGYQGHFAELRGASVPIAILIEK